VFRTLFAWAVGAINTAFWATVSLAGSLIDGSGSWAHMCMVRWSRINLRVMGTRVEVHGLDNIRRDGGQILAANHQSMADILVLAANLPIEFRFVAKRELFDIPFLGWHMRRAGFIPIERSQPRRAARTLLEAAQRVQTGVNALVFPEGTRSHDGRLRPFLGGGFLLAMRAGVPVVPIAIDGTSIIAPKGQWTIRPAHARLTVLPAIDTVEFGRDREALTAQVRASIQEALPQPAAADDSEL